MALKYRISCACVSLLVLLSVLLSCNSEPPENGEQGQWLKYEYEYVDVLIPFQSADYTDWRTDIAVLRDDSDGEWVGQRWIAADDPEYALYDFSKPIRVSVERPYTYTYVLGTVDAFLKSKEMKKKEYLLRLNCYLWENKSYTGNDCYLTRDGKLQEWCDINLPDAKVVAGTGYICWSGTPSRLLELATASCTINVCFTDDFEAIHGMPIEKAQELIEAGELDIWSCPVEGSPLYGKAPAEIAAYLAAQEQQ